MHERSHLPWSFGFCSVPFRILTIALTSAPRLTDLLPSMHNDHANRIVLHSPRTVDDGLPLSSSPHPVYSTFDRTICSSIFGKTVSLRSSECRSRNDVPPAQGSMCLSVEEVPSPTYQASSRYPDHRRNATSTRTTREVSFGFPTDLGMSSETQVMLCSPSQQLPPTQSTSI
jgi:hypothetical protein